MAHITMVIRNIGEGGAERMVLRTAAGLVGRGHRVDVVLFEPTVAYTEDIPQQARFVMLCGHTRWARRKSETLPERTLWRSERVPVTRLVRLIAKILGKYGSGCLLLLLRRRVLAYALRLARYMQCEQPDVVFANLPHSEFAALFAARMVSAPYARPPIVPIIHGVVKPGAGLARQRRLLTPEAAHYVTVSRGMAENLSSVCHVPKAMITTIHNPAYSSGIARQSEAPADHPWFTDGGPPIILSVGRLVPDKDFFTLLDAFATVLRGGASLPPPHLRRRKVASRTRRAGAITRSCGPRVAAGLVRESLRLHVSRRAIRSLVAQRGLRQRARGSSGLRLPCCCDRLPRAIGDLGGSGLACPVGGSERAGTSHAADTEIDPEAVMFYRPRLRGIPSNGLRLRTKRWSLLSRLETAMGDAGDRP